MAKVRSRDTDVELLFRKAMFAKGYRFRVCAKELPGKPDLVFPSKRLAVFLDGDFWHGNQWRKRKLTSVDDQFVATDNKTYWQAKIRKNRQRDFRNTSALLDLGWKVLRFWGSDLEHDLHACLTTTMETLDAQGTPNSKPQQGSASLLASRNVVEFFAGIGLVRLALASQGWNVVHANDFDPAKVDMYRSNFSDESISGEDIHKISAKDLPAAALFTASFPCNDLSLAGSRAGLDGKNSSAFWGLVRILSELGERKPPLLLLENVVGFLTSRKGEDFRSAIAALDRLGYACDPFILDASWFTPQSRRRLFVVAIDRELILEDQSAPRDFSLQPSLVRPAPLTEFIANHPELAWSLRSLPHPPTRSTTLQDVLEDLPNDHPAWWSHKRVAYFMGQLSERHAGLAREMIAKKTWSYATAFRRVRHGRSMAELRTDGTAGCLRTPRGGSGRQILFAAGNGEHRVRLLTPRECARLQGAPDDFRIETTDNQALFGFGDAVCVPVIEWIAENYLNPLAAELIRGRPLCSVSR